MKNYTHLINELFNQPHLVTASYFQTLCGAVADRLNLSHLELNGEVVEAERLKVRAELFNSEKPHQRQYFYEMKDGIAIIPIGGTLVHKNGYLHTSSGMTGYDGIKRRIDYAYSDPEVKGIFYIYNTPGGHVVGNFELCDFMHSLKGKKPTAALIDSQACSAGFSLASTADYRYITEHSITGSIGVLLPHISKQGQLEKEGVKVDIIHAGNHKIDGNPFQDLSAEVRNKMQKTVDVIYNRFTSSVARNMGIDEKIIRDTQAQVYMGQDAVDIGLADELCPSFEAFDRFKQCLQNKSFISQSTTMALGPEHEGEKTMSTEEQKAPSGENNVLSGAQQKARCAAIITLGANLNCAAVAQVIALDTETSAEDAEKILTAVNENTPTVEAAQTQDGAKAFAKQVEQADAGAISPEATEEVDGEPAEASQLERVLKAAGDAGLNAQI